MFATSRAGVVGLRHRSTKQVCIVMIVHVYTVRHVRLRVVERVSWIFLHMLGKRRGEPILRGTQSQFVVFLEQRMSAPASKTDSTCGRIRDYRYDMTVKEDKYRRTTGVHVWSPHLDCANLASDIVFHLGYRLSRYMRLIS